MKDNIKIIFECLKPILITLMIFFATYGILFLFNISEFANKVEYYENGIKIDAIEYHNEIYLKKGE